MAKTITFYDVLVNFVSLLTFMLDVATDILVAVQLFEAGDVVWGCLTAAFVGVPTIIIQIFSLKWHLTDKTLSVASCLPHLFLFAPVQRYLRVIRLGLKARSTRKFQDVDRVFREQNDVCILRLLESFMEAAPQLCLQLYIILMSDKITVLTAVSTVSSLISLAWALTAYSDGLRLAYRDLYQRNWCGLLLHWLWQTSMTAARVLALVVFTLVFKAWVFVVVGVHWIAMVIAISVRGTDFGEGSCEKALFQVVAGFIYIFCFLNLQDGQSRYRMLAYYLVVLAENTALVAAWFFYRDSITPVLDVVTPAVVFGGFLLGVVSLLVYYRFLHPGGPIYLYFVKKVTNTGVWNNQVYQRPSIFDATNTTPMSVLGNDIIELSYDMDSTKMNLSRISNLSSASYSQKNIQRLWDLDLPQCSSSSDSSLDMMGAGSRRGYSRDSSTRQLLQASRSSSVSDGRLCGDRPYRLDDVRNFNSNCNYQTRTPRGKVFTQKDIYGFHEDRFKGTYYSPTRRGSCDSLGMQPPSLSPLNASKLWEDTAGRLRAPLVGREDDTLSSLDVSDLMERSYGRNRLSFSWSRSSWSTAHSVTVCEQDAGRSTRQDIRRRGPSPGDLHSSLRHQDRTSDGGGQDSSEVLTMASCRDTSLPDIVDSTESLPVGDHTYCKNVSTGMTEGQRCRGEKYVYHSPRSKDYAYHSPRSVDVYHSPKCEDVYRSPKCEDVYRSPKCEDVYHTPRSENYAYHSPRSEDYAYQSPRCEDVYHSPRSEDVYHSPKCEDVYRSPKCEDVYRSPRCEDVYHSSPCADPRSCSRSNGSDYQSPMLTTTSNRTEGKPSQSQGPLSASPSCVRAPDFQHTQSVPAVMRHTRRTLPHDIPSSGQYEDIHAACDALFPDTPWRLDYLNLEPCQTVLDLHIRHIAEVRDDSLQELKSSVKSGVRPSPLKVQEFKDSPARLGRNIDLFNIHSRETEQVQSSRRSLNSHNSSNLQRPLSGGDYSGYSQRYIDAVSRKESSPFGMYRHSAKMSQIRGSQAGVAPVRGSPMPVKHRVRDGVERRKSREALHPGQTRGSYSQKTSRNRYKKRLSGEVLKENVTSDRNGEPMLDSWSSSEQLNNLRSRSGDRRGDISREPSATRTGSSCMSGNTSSDDVLYEPLDSYRQAINNSNRLASVDLDGSELQMEDLNSSSQSRACDGQSCTPRQPFQPLQNTPTIPPMGDIKKVKKQPPVKMSVTSGTPKLNSGIQALMEAYDSPVVTSNSPVIASIENHTLGTTEQRPHRRKEPNVARARSMDYLR